MGGRARGARLGGAFALVSALLGGCLDSPGDDDGGGDGGDGDPAPVQLLTNPSFEEDLAGWFTDGAPEIKTTSELDLPDSEAGPHVAFFGGEDMQMDILVQELVVPDTAHELELTGLRCYITTEGLPQIFDTFSIAIEPLDGSPPDVLLEDDNLDATSDTCDWLPFRRTSAVDHAGKEIRVVIQGLTDDGAPTSFAIDGLALTAAP